MASEKIDSGVINIPPPMEETDPELAAFFQHVVAQNVIRKDKLGRGKLSAASVEQFIYDGVGRNDPCPCGSTNEEGKPKKFKKCCMYQDVNLTPDQDEV